MLNLFRAQPTREEKHSAEVILTLQQLLQVESHDVPLTDLLGLSIIILISYHIYPMGWDKLCGVAFMLPASHVERPSSISVAFCPGLMSLLWKPEASNYIRLKPGNIGAYM